MVSNKVLLVANTDWYLYNFRLALAHFLRSKGLDVVMVAPSGKFSVELQAQGFRFVEWNVGRRTMSPPAEAQAVAELIKIYQSEKPILVHHFTIKPVLYGSFAAKFVKISAVVNSVTGLGYVFLKEGWRGKILRLLILPFYRFALSYAHLRFIFENENDQATFIHLGLVKACESVVIRGVGVNADLFRPAPEPSTLEPIIVFPARMLLDKGLGTLIEAARIIKRKTKARFILVGDIDQGNPSTVEESTIIGWVQEGLVEWWGFQSDMLSVYQNCNIVTLPSFGEGLPTALIEAAACERSIVTTDVAGCREVVENGVNGLLVLPNQPEALAKAIERLIHSPEERLRMGKAGRLIVLEKFTDKQVNREIFKVYAGLLGSRVALSSMA
jgi:glycosyltransferase involved in cell wall biosynthesis